MTNNTSSCEDKVTCGVSQGSILGPLLFGLTINDIHIPLGNADIIINGDDTVLYYGGQSRKEIEQLLIMNCKKLPTDLMKITFLLT